MTDYVLGHSDRELERLSAQARAVDPMTRRFFSEAGIGPHMVVLDVGSGAGDVALLAAELVGGSGEVVGVGPIAGRTRGGSRACRRTVGAKRLVHRRRPGNDRLRAVLSMRRLVASLSRFRTTRQRCSEPLRRSCGPAARSAFHELDWSGVQSTPPVPTYDRCCRLIEETISRVRGRDAHGRKSFVLDLHRRRIARTVAATRGSRRRRDKQLRCSAAPSPSSRPHCRPRSRNRASGRPLTSTTPMRSSTE